MQNCRIPLWRYDRRGLNVEMVDNPEEFGELATFVQEYSGIDETLQEKVDEAKN